MQRTGRKEVNIGVHHYIRIVQAQCCEGNDFSFYMKKASNLEYKDLTLACVYSKLIGITPETASVQDNITQPSPLQAQDPKWSG